MAKIISQETFDDVVKENIVDFSMSPDEAKEETIKQFEAQGITLANIIKDLKINAETGKPVLNETIESLKQYVANKSTDSAVLVEHLTVLDEECQKSIPHRVLAGKNGVQDTLITLLEQELSSETPNLAVLKACIQAANSLTNKQPDIFDMNALRVVLKLLNLQDDEVICLALKWLQKASIMHENNRQTIMNACIVKVLKPLINKERPNVVREVLAVFRFLVLDDDIRVEFGCAHEHARQIASEVLLDITQLLTAFDDVEVLADILLTIGALAVRQEFCTVIDEAGCLKLIFDIMAKNLNAVRLNREALKLIRALGGNDTVKAHIVQQGVAPIIKELLQLYINNENVVAAALACVSILTLRVKENSTIFFETGIAEIIVEAMRVNPNHKIIQRNGAWAIRNMVSRSREQCDTWLSFGVEDLLNTAMVEHKSVQQDIKAALRDLGCAVELKEEWTGVAEKKIQNNNL